MTGERTTLTVLLTVMVSAMLAGPADGGTVCRAAATQPRNVGTSDNFLTGVVALPSCNAVAVGVYRKATVYRTLIERWNGILDEHLGRWHSLDDRLSDPHRALGRFGVGSSAQPQRRNTRRHPFWCRSNVSGERMGRG